MAHDALEKCCHVPDLEKAVAVAPLSGKTTTHNTSDSEESLDDNQISSPIFVPETIGTGAQVNHEDERSHLPDDTTVATADDFPDGGTSAWLVVLGAWCASFCGYGWINSIGTFQEYYQTGPLKEYSASQISWIPSLQIFFMSFLGPPIGIIYDRYGPRWLVLGGSFLHVFGLMMASLSTQYYQFLLSQGICSAMGTAAVFLCAICSIPGWFKKRRGLAYGMMATGSSVGGVIFPIMITHLIPSVGYGWAMRSTTLIILGLLVVANLTIRKRTVAGPRTPKLTSGRMGRMGRPFRERAFQFLLLGLFLVPFGLYVPINYLPVAAIEGGMEKSMSHNLVAFYNAASLFGRLGSGWLSDRLGKFNVFICACYVAGALVLGMWIPASNDATVIAFAALFGIFSGAYISLMGALVAQISPPEESGYRQGLTFLGSAIGGLITNPLAGAILKTSAGWDGLKTFAGVFLLAGTTGIAVARASKTGPKLVTVF